MQAVTLGLHNLDGTAAGTAGMSGTPPFNQGNMNMDPAQLQQLLQLLGAAHAHSMQPATVPMSSGASVGVGTGTGTGLPLSMTGLVSGPLGPHYTGQPPTSSTAPKQTAIVECPKNMVGRVIGKGGETIKALQQYTGAMIQIDQSTDPTRVTIAGSPQSLQLAVSMVNDIVRGTFKGFAMLRQIAISSNPNLNPFGQPQPVYVQGYGFVPPSQVFSGDEQQQGSSQMFGRTSPRGPLTPPITPLRTAGTTNIPGGSLPPEAMAALLAGQPGSGQPSSSYPNQEALLAQLLERLSVNQQAANSNQAVKQAGLEQGAIQTMLAQAGIMSTMHPAASSQPGVTGSTQQFPPSSSVMLSAQGTPALVNHEGPSSSTAAGVNTAGSYRMGSMPTATVPPPSHRPGSVSPTNSIGVIGSTAGLQATSPSAAFTIGAPSTGSQAGDSQGRVSPPTNFAGLAATASNPSMVNPPPLASVASGDGSPLGRYGAIGSGVVTQKASEGRGLSTFGSWDERRSTENSTLFGTHHHKEANGSRGGSGSDPVWKEHSERSGSQQSGGLPPFPIDSPWDELLQ